MEPPNIAASLQWFPSPSTGVQPKWSRSSCMYDAKATTSMGGLPPAPKCKLMGVAKRQCHTHVGEPWLGGGRRPRDAWEERSLKKQVREIVCQRSRSNSGYSRGPEILEALEKLKSKSHL
jgi:hypothetical protein